MAYITAAVTIIITLYLSRAEYVSYLRVNSSVVVLKQGKLQGDVVAFRTNRNLPLVEQYRGIPYAAAPVGEFRFMPPGSAPGFSDGFRYAHTFGPVCPQKFPDTSTMTPQRLFEFLRLQEFLRDQSEDCLYLNVYAPYRGDSLFFRSYPVMVFIHGESFEWNSGNAYDGSVLAAYGKVIVVTLNYRLGVFGFLKTGEEYFKSNFGLVDQIAALLWVKDNIKAFGGDPDAVTLFGHGTGAVCANLLMLSPMVLQKDNKTLFQRAVLMGGSALSDWALASDPFGVTSQVAKALDCRVHDDLAACLRRKSLPEILSAPVSTLSYQTRFGPVIDNNLIVPDDPKKLMTAHSDMFRRFDLMYGVTGLESIHLLPADALKHGMEEKERDRELRRYLELRCGMKPELCVARTLEEYTKPDDVNLRDYSGYERDRATTARDVLLNILSDARTVAPMIQMAKYHSGLNNSSYFYVFTHKTLSKDHITDKSYTGEELPYVFGAPLGGSRSYFTDSYTENERLFSEVIMTYFSNFAHTGNPKMPRKNGYYTLNIKDWIKFNVDWPPFDAEEQKYLQMGIPSYNPCHYRHERMTFWNDIFSNITSKRPQQTPAFVSPKSPPPWILTHPPRKSTSYLNKYENFNRPYEYSHGVVRISGTSAPNNIRNNVVYGTVVKSPGEIATPPAEPESKGISSTVTIAMCSIFLLSNLCLFLVLYWTCYRKRKLRNRGEKHEETPVNLEEVDDSKLMDGCNIMKIVSKSERTDDTYEAVKSSGRYKVPRQMSSSTIDAHTKVRDWITNEIVYKYSPRFLRHPRHSNDNKSQESKFPNDNISTLGGSPTRPVSPCEAPKNRPPLIKSSSIPVQKMKNVEKVSVAIDATPSGRGPSVLAQQPIELTKSLDHPLRRSLTLEDFSLMEPTPNNKKELRKSTTSINMKFTPPSDTPTVIRIEHAHSKSDPVQNFATTTRKLKTFDPASDVNVTCREENNPKVPLTPEESLMTIKKRNFPKVLPDYPTRETLTKKRRSMPVANHLFSTIPEAGQFQPISPTHKTFGKLPPAPPLRTTSTLSRKASIQQTTPVCQSAPMLAEEPPASPEPEVACNNLYVGPLIPKKTDHSSSESVKLNTQPIYDKLRTNNEGGDKSTGKIQAKTIITTDPKQPIKKAEPKVIIKPSMVRNLSDPKKHIPRVNLNEDESAKKVMKPSQIPTLFKGKESSSSEESDTGTVVKMM